MTQPDANDLASVLATVISSDRTSEEILDGTGVVSDDVQPAIAHLLQRDIIRSVSGSHYHASQTRCAGPCTRDGRAIRGQEVVIDSKTLRWTCADCWDGRNRTIAPGGDKPGVDDQ
jgi:hypothetical protein